MINRCCCVRPGDDLAAEHEGKQITFADTQVQPVPVIVIEIVLF